MEAKTILVANIAAASPGGVEGDFVRRYLGPAIRANLKLGAAADHRFRLVWSCEGEAEAPFTSAQYLQRLAPGRILAALQAGLRKEAADAALIACFGDPELEEAEAALSIPVTGFGRSALQTVKEKGVKAGLIAPADILIAPFRDQARRAGVPDDQLMVVASRQPAERQELGFIDARETIQYFVEDAEALIAKGAEIIVPACGLQSNVLRLAANHDGPIVRVGAAPVLDVLANAVSRLERQFPSAEPFWEC